MTDQNDKQVDIVTDDNAKDDFDFVDHYGAEIDTSSEDQLPDNTAKSALNCAFVYAR